MYKVMIVEDEMLVRVGLKNLIDWKRFNMEVVADESNGQAAWQTFEKERPDIVITDIVMPIMDGIQLISEIRKIDDYQTKFIILTCMEDFKTVHAAMNMGVSSYIVKLTMTEAEIETELLKLKNELDAMSVKVSAKPIENKVSNKEDLLKNQILYNLYSKDEFVRNLKEINPFIVESNLFLCMIEVDQLSRAHKRYAHHLKSTLLNIMNETLQEYDDVEVFCDDEHRFILLFSAREIRSENRLNVQLRGILMQIQQNILRYLKIHVSIGVSEHYDDFSRLKTMYEECTLALHAKFYSELGGIHVYNRDMNSFKKAHESAVNRISKLSEQYEELLGKEHIANIRNSFSGIDYQTDQYTKRVKNYALQWLQIPSAVYNGMGQQFYAILDAYSTTIQESETFNEIISAHQGYIRELSELSKRNLSREIVMAREFIERNFANEVSLEQAAKHVGLSSNYLSYLFKKELDVNFIDYLISYRIEKAKGLLESTNLKFYEIAERVGFNDNTYFSRAFKKITGMNPNEYQKKIK